MENLQNLKDKYTKLLSTYPFQSEEEAKVIGIKNFILAEKDEYTALETPFTMRQVLKKKPVQKSTKKDFIEESSSEGESTDESPFYDDIHIIVDLFVKGKQIVDSCELTIVRNRKYGLVGRNGIGKTSLLKAIRKRRFGIPKGLKIHAIRQDYVSDEKVIDYVGGDGMQALKGLGFTKEQMELTIRSLSGGWRMRAQLAKAIHLNPDLVLLDEPTNFLDLKAIAYLESKVKDVKTVIIVSHDRNFLDNTVDHILHLNDMKIEEYSGNYSKFKLIRAERLARLTKEYENQMEQRAHLQSFIDRFRYNKSKAAQAQSKIKMLEKMPVLHLPKIDPAIKFSFGSTTARGTLLEMTNVSFEYKNGKKIFDCLNLRIDHKSRIVIVGDNGQGKSTLLKLLTLGLKPTSGTIETSPDAKIGYFAQHHVDHLDHSEYVLSFLMKKYREDEARAALSRFGLNVGNQQIGTLSGGQKSRLAFTLISLEKPNILVMDEPTNHLDMETIEALAAAVSSYEGAVIAVSHDLAFIEQAFNDVYVCEGGKLTWFRGTANDYKNSLKLIE